MDLNKIYTNRFGLEKELSDRKQLWSVLCRRFFQRHVKSTDVVLDIAAGYCEFINHIQCKQKIAIDLNSDTQQFANRDVQVICESCADMKSLSDGCIDVAFVSNFFEHLDNHEMLFSVLREIHRALKPKGKLLVLQPNIRFLYDEYWDFVDHKLPLSDRSTAEALSLAGFKVIKVIPRFLPYTTKSKIPKSPWLVEIYLRIPLLWRLFGKQAFIEAEK
jgi:SAM-dependent methyltransferase